MIYSLSGKLVHTENDLAVIEWCRRGLCLQNDFFHLAADCRKK